MIEKNIIYKTKELERYYSRNRIKWKEFYPSEKKIINLLNMKNKKILDLGCACGGLGVVLKKKFKKINYTGVEINKRSAIKAKLLNKSSKIINCDVQNDAYMKKSIYCKTHNALFVYSMTSLAHNKTQ